ncbi:hypothetical protein [Massilia sp. UBA6681]|uniref:hypothetical protein n=1 Tax=Massilia sp. UBA6681 TaxID=1946839 RepID=UPI0025BA0E88|nr:hypothetical protein [Massilia sp. UBA6681]
MLKKDNRFEARLRPGERPVLIVVVDTEEEFSWERPFDRANVDTTSIADQPLMHERVFDRFGIVPMYMCDWPVATTASSVATLRGLMEEGRCEIGTHLHPWVSPPHVEQVSAFNSYAGNLPREVEYEKLRRLTNAIADFSGAPHVLSRQAAMDSANIPPNRSHRSVTASMPAWSHTRRSPMTAAPISGAMTNILSGSRPTDASCSKCR